jgi:hypothetical protein
MNGTEANRHSARKPDGGLRFGLSHAMDVPLTNGRLDGARKESAHNAAWQPGIVGLKFFGGLLRTAAQP